MSKTHELRVAALDSLTPKQLSALKAWFEAARDEYDNGEVALPSYTDPACGASHALDNLVGWVEFELTEMQAGKVVGGRMFVLHSPYPDGSWRGLEKCPRAEDESGALLVFETAEEAEAYRQKNPCPEFLRVVEVFLNTPDVREKLPGEGGLG